MPPKWVKLRTKIDHHSNNCYIATAEENSGNYVKVEIEATMPLSLAFDEILLESQSLPGHHMTLSHWSRTLKTLIEWQMLIFIQTWSNWRCVNKIIIFIILKHSILQFYNYLFKLVLIPMKRRLVWKKIVEYITLTLRQARKPWQILLVKASWLSSRLL